MKSFKTITFIVAVLSVLSCERKAPQIVPPGGDSLFSLSDVARIMSELPIGDEHLMEVFDAVGASSGNGYDEEYMMSDLFSSPGAGVGDSPDGTKAGASYSRPLRELFTDYLSEKMMTKAGAADVEAYVNSLSDSDIQIYWPYSEEWDGETYPIITFDPGYGAESNYGYQLSFDENGARVVDSVLVTESVAQTRPVWVINRNDDAAFTPLDMFTKSTAAHVSGGEEEDGDGRMLSIKAFQMLRNYDSWFGGASEFFVKCGAVDGFKATTDEQLRLYTPSVTDFMVVVKRSQVGKTVPFNAILLTDYTPQMEKIAFLVTEDDGGETTSWKCAATVKYNSKSYGFDITIPYNDKDDIVWRGQLSRSFFPDRGEVTGRFGDVIITFSLE